MASKASVRLLHLRELCVALGPDMRAIADAVADLPLRVWSRIDDAVGEWDNGLGLAYGWPRMWIEHDGRTHLEVVEMIERAAVAAMKAGE